MCLKPQKLHIELGIFVLLASGLGRCLQTMSLQSEQMWQMLL